MGEFIFDRLTFFIISECYALTNHNITDVFRPLRFVNVLIAKEGKTQLTTRPLEARR